MIIARDEDLKASYDAIVIGSGAGGASLALKLCQHGLEVLLVERGGQLGPFVVEPGKPIGRLLTEVHGSRGNPLSYFGGQTKFYGSALYRFRESDFREVPHKTGVSPAWPISYADLEPYYEEAERLYKVHGSQDGDPTEPRRAAPYPHPALPHAPLIATMADRLERSGTPVAAIPRGLDYGPGRPCVLCPTCDQYACSLDAKMDAEIAAFRPALATGRLTVAERTECLGILTDPAGRRVEGVRLGRGGNETKVGAGVVAVAGGLLQTTELLRRSRNSAHPEGLGNQGGALGRYLAGHSTGMFFVMTGWRKIPAMHTKTFAINAFYEGSQTWRYPLGMIQIAGQLPFWNEASRPMRPLAKLIGQHSVMGFYMCEALPSRETGYTFDGDRLGHRTEPRTDPETFRKMREVACNAFRQAGYAVIARKRAPYIWHETGLARLGDDPATSVVDPNLQVHGVQGLYVADATVLPTAGAVNTGLTIIALALRAGDHIAGRRPEFHTAREAPHRPPATPSQGAANRADLC